MRIECGLRMPLSSPSLLPPFCLRPRSRPKEEARGDDGRKQKRRLEKSRQGKGKREKVEAWQGKGKDAWLSRGVVEMLDKGRERGSKRGLVGEGKREKKRS